MNSNTHSVGAATAPTAPAGADALAALAGADGLSAGRSDELRSLAMAVDRLAAQDRSGLSDAARAEGVLVLRRLPDRLEGLWLGELAAVDAHRAAGADEGQQAPSTAGWLRARPRAGAGAAAGWVRTARALSRGP
jgi:hypothetical protein